jgi:hypothetical protein
VTWGRSTVGDIDRRGVNSLTISETRKRWFDHWQRGEKTA